MKALDTKVAQPDVVAGLVSYLVSTETYFVTGELRCVKCCSGATLMAIGCQARLFLLAAPGFSIEFYAGAVFLYSMCNYCLIWAYVPIFWLYLSLVENPECVSRDYYTPNSDECNVMRFIFHRIWTVSI
jgi:hypothetical protein